MTCISAGGKQKPQTQLIHIKNIKIGASSLMRAVEFRSAEGPRFSTYELSTCWGSDTSNLTHHH